MSVANPTAAMTVNQVAAELGSNSISVLRLIARGVLPAVVVGKHQREYRIAPSHFANYVESGAFDYVLIDDSFGWFPSDPLKPRFKLQAAYAKAAEDQRPNQAELRRVSPGPGGRPRMSVAVRATEAILAVSKQTRSQTDPWSALFGEKDKQQPVDHQVFDLWLADELHSSARNAIESLRSKTDQDAVKDSYARFYASSDTYREAVAAAIERVKQKRFLWHETVVIKTDPDENPKEPVHVDYVLTADSAAGSQGELRRRIDRMIEYAF